MKRLLRHIFGTRGRSWYTANGVYMAVPGTPPIWRRSKTSRLGPEWKEVGYIEDRGAAWALFAPDKPEEFKIR